ncbi:DoxX family protein [Celeribacter sp. PS-C1]|uniref:DoxX family protein n=1 Tax=Celeribacter sp. PS-C1 TaxID=2820813 RepID=UPI001CA49AAC|nr:DoxX family protein [Celeribacter sp. PS-C1]MBW6417211.1 DoxX family protein [Celeribacter sp. PS-C1]
MSSYQTLTQRLTDVCCLGLRLALAYTLLLHPVTLTLRLSEPMQAYATSFDSRPSVFLLHLSDIRDLIVAMLFVLIGAWLILGIHTRIIALFAAALVGVFHFAVSHEPTMITHEAVHVLIILLFAIPVIVFGGGKLSILRSRRPSLA